MSHDGANQTLVCVCACCPSAHFAQGRTHFGYFIFLPHQKDVSKAGARAGLRIRYDAALPNPRDLCFMGPSLAPSPSLSPSTAI